MDEYMHEALKEAKIAYELGEVPVGAVIVLGGEIIARAGNRTKTLKDPTAHAELLAIREAARKLGNERLTACELYVTAEPCSMCAGALVWARIKRLYIGAMDPKAGACGSLYNIADDPRLNHRVEIETGLLAEECGGILKAFFRERREDARLRKQSAGAVCEHKNETKEE